MASYPHCVAVAVDDHGAVVAIVAVLLVAAFVPTPCHNP
jgi:hypothetical protein